MSVTDPAVELTIGSVRATDRELRRSSLWQAGAAGSRVPGGSYLFPATRTDEAAPAWQAPARLTIARRACTASRQILDWRNWTPSDQQLQHLAACIDSLCWLIVVNMSFSGMFENRLYQYRDRRRQRILYAH